MNVFKFFWTTHKWTGIILSLVFLNIALTGFFLILKKRFDWIQPPTIQGSAGGLEDFITVQRLVEVVLAHGHADFKTLDDIDRVDFRPGRRVHKVRSKHNHSELQIDAITGAVLSDDWRPSDLLETLHDGSFYAEWMHDWLMPLVALALVFMVCSGLYIWLAPLLRKRRRRRERRS